MRAFLFDLRTAARQLGKTPGFTAAAVLMLTVGIGATVAIFSIVSGILLRPLPFPHADRLVAISDVIAGTSGPNGADGGSGSTAQDIQNEVQDSRSFASLGGWEDAGLSLSGDGSVAENIMAAKMTSGVFPALGVTPLLGRVFTAQEDTGHAPVAVISYGLWHDRFQANRDVLGRKILLDRKPYTVIGVMPRSFEFPLASGLATYKLWVPMSFGPAELSATSDSSWRYHIVGRLKPGVTGAEARADLSAVDHETMREYPPYMMGFRITPMLTSLHADTVDAARPMLHLLFLAVAVVLLIACANLAGLLLVRGLRRRRETAVRIALGARAVTLLRQELLGSLLLSLSGALLGTLLATAAVRFGLILLPESLPLIHQIDISWSVLCFAFALALLTGLVCGSLPALTALNTDMNEALKEGGRTGSAGGSHARLRSVLVVIEIAVALALVSASGLLLRSFEKMGAVQLGYEPSHMVTAHYVLPKAAYPTQIAISNFNREAFARTQRLPGVDAASVTSLLPASGGGNKAPFVADGYVAPPSMPIDMADLIDVQGNYFQAMGAPLLRGRYLTPEDTAHTQLVAVVNQKLAEQTWPKQDPIGKQLRLGVPSSRTPWITVIGEVANMKEGAPDAPDNQQIYVQLDQQTKAFAPVGAVFGDDGFINLRTSLPPEQMENALRSVVHSIDPQLALDTVETMEQALTSVEAPRRFDTTLISVFAATALVLALLGIYSILAFSVTLRTHEMAIRLALGSQRGSVVRLVLASGAKLAAIGSAVGLGLAIAGEHLIASLLFGVSATDPWILSAAAAAVFLATLAITLVPASRAAAVNPVDALQAQ